MGWGSTYGEWSSQAGNRALPPAASTFGLPSSFKLPIPLPARLRYPIPNTGNPSGELLLQRQMRNTRSRGFSFALAQHLGNPRTAQERAGEHRPLHTSSGSPSPSSASSAQLGGPCRRDRLHWGARIPTQASPAVRAEAPRATPGGPAPAAAGKVGRACALTAFRGDGRVADRAYFGFQWGRKTGGVHTIGVASLQSVLWFTSRH